jgi:O-antigen/teichoic acid export membrane protein
VDRFPDRPVTPRMTPLEISAPSLVRNAFLNFIGQFVYLLVGIAAIPFVVRGLGAERFGLLSLAWVILGYFTTFDLGLGRATTKYVAESLGKGEEDQVPRLAWTAVTIQGAFGLLGALVLVGVTSLLVEQILKIPPTLVEEAKATFHILALAIPVVLISGSFSGLLEASQRFDLLNAVRIPSGASMFLLPLVGLALGFHLSGIVALIVVSRVAALAALVTLNLRLFPQLRRFSACFAAFPRLLTYGGWVTVTSLVGPILLNLDRFLIASLLSMAAVAYYTAPYEIVIRLWIVPVSLTMSLFPAFSALEGMGDRQKLGTLFARSVVYTLLALAPLVLILGLFAEEILLVWLGSDFAAQSKAAMRILVLGAFVGSAAHIPSALLQGAGRPDVTAKIHLLELPLYVGIAWVLISREGVVGAAAAWTLRVALDALLLFVASFGVCRLSPRLLAANGLMLTSLSLLALAGAAYGLKSLGGALPLLAQLVLFAVLLGLFALIVWRKVLDDFDRGVVLRVVTLSQGPTGTPWG